MKICCECKKDIDKMKCNYTIIYEEYLCENCYNKMYDDKNVNTIIKEIFSHHIRFIIDMLKLILFI